MRNLMKASALTLAALAAAHPGVACADAYDDLRTKWVAQITGGTSLSTTDTDIVQQVAAQTATAQAYWSAMHTESGRTTLWDDLADSTSSAQMSSSYARLAAMATAYATTGSSLQGNAALAAAIVSALDWLYTNRYNETLSISPNWYDWEIGTPQALNDTVLLMYAQLTATQIAHYMAAIDKFVPDPTVETYYGTTATGANRLDQALVVALRGVIGKSSAKIAQGRDAMSQAFLNVTSSDGFYADGSFIQHTNVAYTGSYGSVLLGDMSRLFYLLNGSSWAITDTNSANVYTWVTNSFKPFMFDGAMMDTTRGRAIARIASHDHDAGRAIARAVVRLAQGATTTQAATLQALAKGWIQRDTSFGNYYTNLSPYDITLIKALLANANVTPTAEAADARVFAGMDRGLLRTTTWAASVGMYSTRIADFEYGNGENLKGWWTGAGMTSLYDADITQYAGNYWATVNQQRLAGTTTDGTSVASLVSFKSYAGDKTWSGGARTSGTTVAALGMDLTMDKVTGSALAGKKSWFLMRDKIIALGAGITGSNGNAVETIVENRKLDAAGDNLLTVNGNAQSSALGWSQTLTGVSWAHLAGSVDGADVGWWFPTAASVAGLRETRSGTWTAVDSACTNPADQTQCTATFSDSYLSLAVPHGINPSAGSYAYVILPGRNTTQMAAFAASPGIVVFENSTAAQAVRDASVGTYAANFWNDAAKTVYWNSSAVLASDHKASLVTRTWNDTSHNYLDIAVADPTQANTGTITVEVMRGAATSLVSADSGVTVVQMTPTVKLQVAVNGSKGKTYNARFIMP